MVYRIFRRKEFAPEALRDMAKVFDEVCHALGLAQTDDALRDLVAETVIRCAQDGERDIERMRSVRAAP